MDPAGMGISFCLPVYNVKRYLEPCIDSICAQGLARYEIICVDDCSTDGSHEELLRLAALHPEMRVIRNPQNSGVSFSRNEALRSAKEAYVWFVDPDDLLPPQTAGRLLTIAGEHSADAVFGRMHSFPDGTEPSVPKPAGEQVSTLDFADVEHYFGLDQYGKRCFGIWIGLFRRAFLMENGIFFHEDLSTWEDVTFHAEAGVCAGKVLQVEDCTYLYRLREQSLTHGKDESRSRRFLQSLKRVLEILQELREKADPRMAASVDALSMRARETLIVHLVRVTDRKLVKAEMRELKRKKLYPYRHEMAVESRNREPRKAFLTDHVLTTSPGFHLVNLSFCLKRRLSDLRRGRRA